MVDPNSFQDQEANFDRFWSLWLDEFIRLRRYDLVLDVVSRSHSRRTAAQALTALYQQRASGTLTLDQTRYLELICALHQIELELMRESRTNIGGIDDLFGLRSFVALPRDEAFQLRQAEIFEVKREQHATLAREARQLKQRLTKAGDLPDVATIDRALRQLSESHADADRTQAVALWVVPQVYGIERAPFLLLVHPTGITPLFHDATPSPVPDLARAIGLEKNLRRRIAAGRCVRDWGSSGATDDVTASSDATTDDPQSLNELDRQLRGFMTRQWWQPLVERCQALGVTTLHLVTAGELHALPWQGSAPSGLKIRLYPSLYGYVKATHPRQETHQRPSPKRPLAVVAHDAHADGLGRRLYCAYLEVECLRAVWGDDAVVVGAENLAGRKPCAVTLIGHGGFDARSGRAGLYLGQDEEGQTKLFDQTALASLPSAYQGLQASACVLGRAVDVEKEPAGLMAAAMAVPSVQSCAGALLPVDDGLATLLSLLFHCHWKAGLLPREAFQAAQASLREGRWPPEATAALQQAAERTLPAMVCALDDDLGCAKMIADDHQREATVKRIEGARTLLTLNRDWEIQGSWRAIHKAMKRHDDPARARAMAREWARLFAQKAPRHIADYEDLAVFVHYWLVS